MRSCGPLDAAVKDVAPCMFVILHLGIIQVPTSIALTVVKGSTAVESRRTHAGQPSRA